MSKEKKITILIIIYAILILFPIVVFAEDIPMFTVTFNSMGGASIDNITVESGSIINRPDDPDYPGFLLTGWYKEEECINDWNFETDTVTSDITLYAQWKEFYTISASPADHAMGAVSGDGDYRSGASVTLYATPKDGYRFVRWIESDSASAVYRLIASANTSFTAKFDTIDIPSLTAEPSGYNSITLNWTPVEYAAGYEVYRSAEPDGEYSLVKSASGEIISYTDNRLITDGIYYYKVRPFCVCETATTYGSFTTPVSAMSELAVPVISAAAGGYRSIKVMWDTVPGASGYEVYRSASQGGTYSSVCTLTSPEASCYTDYSLPADKMYYYKVRAYRKADDNKYFSDYSDIQSAAASFFAPTLSAVSASPTSIRLTWNALSGVSGYELYRGESPEGPFKKIYTTKSAPTIIYTYKGLTTDKTYYFKIRALGKLGSKNICSRFSDISSAVPSTTLPERTFTILYQGDPKWRFSRSVRGNACILSSYAITINNMGIPATPRTVYNSNGKKTYMNIPNLAVNFGVKPVCALDKCSPYLSSYTSPVTYVKNPSVNGVAAIKEALNRNPDGVICYFKRGSKAHAMVACKYDGEKIYYSDPGRTRKKLLTFTDTWTSYRHRMGYRDLAYIVALEKIDE